MGHGAGGGTSYGLLRYRRPNDDQNLKVGFIDVTQPWYNDNAGALGMFTIFEAYYSSLKRHGPGRGYYPEPSNSDLIIYTYNIEARNFFGLHHGSKVCTGARYLCGYIGDDKSKRDWLTNCTEMWERNICTISETMGKYPQESYAALVRAIQLDWIFLQCVTNNMGDVFSGVETMI